LDGVQVFDKLQGILIRIIGSKGCEVELKFPGGLVIQDDELYVADNGHSCIQVYTLSTGEWLHSWGKNLNEEFLFPGPMALDKNNLYIRAKSGKFTKIHVFE